MGGAPYNPDAARRRHAAAVRERTVRFTPGPDGMASLWARLTAADALGCYRELCELADSAAPPPDTAPTASEPGLPPGGAARDDRTADDRTADDRRADTLVDLIMGAATRLHPEDGAACAPVPTPARPGADNVPDDASAADTDADTEVAAAAPAALRRPPPQARDGRGRARIDVTVARTTLAGLDDQPGYLRGYGPIDADAARELAADATWRRLLTDPANDTVLDVGTTRYSPPGAMAALVQATGPDLSLVRLPPARCPLRPGPHRPVPAGSHRHPQPRRTMSRAPPAENPHPMAGRAERRRRADLDQPRRTTGQDRTLAPRPAPATSRPAPAASRPARTARRSACSEAGRQPWDDPAGHRGCIAPPSPLPPLPRM
ncbi:MAG: DUF222 domain-containing protein [Geodermatophilaceae bacterium]|nr:DUF222 domain-containing protein [Geodermatophilaceae bacterium]